MLKENLKFDKKAAQTFITEQKLLGALGNPKLESNLISELMHKYSSYEECMWALFKESKTDSLSLITFLLQEITLLEPELAWSCLIKQKKYSKEYTDRHHRSKFIVDTK